MKKALLRVANCENVTERNPAEEARLALTKKGKYGKPEIVVFSEISWLRLGDLALELGFDWLQVGQRGSPEAGVGIASRWELDPIGILVGSRPTAEGGGVRMRPILGAEVAGLPVPIWAIHAPPPDSPMARDRYFARARQCRGVMAGDWNRRPDWMRDHMKRDYRGIGVLGTLAAPRIQLGIPAPVGIRSDHKAVDQPLRWR